MGVAIEINGSQVFEHVRAIYLSNESFGGKNPDYFWFFFCRPAKDDFNAISMTGIPYTHVIEKKKNKNRIGLE